MSGGGYDSGPPSTLGGHDWGFDENGFDTDAYKRLLGLYAQYTQSWCPMFDPYMAALSRQNGVALSRSAVVRDAEWYRSHYYREAHRDTKPDATLLCYLRHPNRMPGVVLVRDRGEADFNARQVSLVQEAFALIHPLVGGLLANFTEPSPSELPPRVRQVLRCLLEGHSDKQIAVRLRISKYTVNQYVKVIFHHFGVQSRPELLARWIRRGWGAPFAWADE